MRTSFAGTFAGSGSAAFYHRPAGSGAFVLGPDGGRSGGAAGGLSGLRCRRRAPTEARRGDGPGGRWRLADGRLEARERSRFRDRRGDAGRRRSQARAAASAVPRFRWCSRTFGRGRRGQRVRELAAPRA